MGMILKASEEAMTAAVINELITGRQLLDTLEHSREVIAAQEAQKFKGHFNKKAGMMHLAEIPFHEYVRIEKENPGFWDDRANLRHVQKTHPHLFSHKV